MAETLISPGVLARENDQSFISQGPITVGAAIIGPTVKGPYEIPTIVTSYSDYQAKFGTTFNSGGQAYTYFTSIAAYNYFNNGGETLLVARVASGTFTAATTATASVNGCSILGSGSSANTEIIILETLSEGAIMNNSGSLGTNGTLSSGSANNVRWQTLNRNESTGTFDLLIRRGDDTSLQPIVLETWTNLSLDPFAPNYVAATLGDILQIIIQQPTKLK